MSGREKLLFGVLGLLGLAAWLARTDKGRALVSDAVETVAGSVRGLRNRNPGNIEYSAANDWLGQTGSDGRFAVFSEMRYGVRASIKLFRNYQARYGLESVRDLISRASPPSENDTEAYIARVAQRVGVAAGVPIDLRNRDTAYDFLRGVFREENGVAADLIPAATIYDGIEAAA